jgi:uncharacterized membrane protein YqgA involved in biofilm formation
MTIDPIIVVLAVCAGALVGILLELLNRDAGWRKP